MNRLLLPNGISETAVEQALRDAEVIAAKDGSSLYATSRFFEDRARYDAFCGMYAVMRVIDDLVDDVPDKATLPAGERATLRAALDRWEQRVRAAYRGEPDPSESLDIALAAAVATFPVPLQLWLSFLDSMRFDVDVARFSNFAEFVRYGEGATVAPTAIFVYLLSSVRADASGGYVVPSSFDFLACGRDLGLFAYVAHVLRDVRADLEVGRTGLVYLAAADLEKHQLGEDDLRTMSAREQGDARWTGLARMLVARARGHQTRGRAMAEAHWPALAPDCAFVFSLIIDVYAELLQRIDADPDAVWRRASILSDADRFELARGAAARTGYRLPADAGTRSPRPRADATQSARLGHHD